MDAQISTEWFIQILNIVDGFPILYTLLIIRNIQYLCDPQKEKENIFKGTQQELFEADLLVFVSSACYCCLFLSFLEW